MASVVDSSEAIEAPLCRVALSTVFMVMSPEQVERYCAKHKGVLALLITEQGPDGCGPKEHILRFGRWEEAEPV